MTRPRARTLAESSQTLRALQSVPVMVTCCRMWDAKSRRQSRSGALHLDRARDSLRLEGGSTRGTECAASHVFSVCARTEHHSCYSLLKGSLGLCL